MKRLRLLPIVLFATSSLLALKVIGLATGAGSFALGPVAAAAEDAGHGAKPAAHGAAADDAVSIEDPIILGAPLDLSKEAADLARQQEQAAGHGGGHEAAPAADAGHGAPAADAGHGAAPAADAGHGAAPAAADAGHGAAPAEAAAPADHAAAPAEGGHAAPAEGGHGAQPKLPEGVSTVRPAEYQPPGSQSEAAVLDALAARRKQLDQRETEIDLRMKLLQAAELKLQQRVDELKNIQNQLGAVPGGGGPGDAGAAPPAPGAAPSAAPGAAPAVSDQVKGLVAMYEAMKPKSAADVFDTLDVQVLLAIAANMNPRKLSPILAAMNPAHAAKLTTLLAGDQGPRQIVIRTVDGSAAPPVSSDRSGGVAAPDPGPAMPAGATDPASLPKIQPAPSG